jgi:hypothetical protein
MLIERGARGINLIKIPLLFQLPSPSRNTAGWRGVGGEANQHKTAGHALKLRTGFWFGKSRVNERLMKRGENENNRSKTKTDRRRKKCLTWMK